MKVDHLLPSDCFYYPLGSHDHKLEVIRDVEHRPDLFGRSMLNYWCRRLDTLEEGYMVFGSGADVELVKP